jgi:peptidoglycan/xylan/chitin deacetylase (PgdA/CDA1 family)
LRPIATVSVDVDPVDLHLIGYGYRALPPDPLIYTSAMPRLLDGFAACGVRATFFVVGRDAAVHRPLLERLVAGGHEVASHSLTHPMALASLPADAMRRELRDSRIALEDACGAQVVGFRSPNFDMNDRAIEQLAEAGFAYDASAYPSPMLIPARLLLALKSRDASSVLKLRMWPFTWRRDAHVRTVGRATLREFPVSVTPVLRWPVYHTLRYAMSDAGFARTLDGFARRGEDLSYPLHAVDALGMAEDKVDARLAPHPGLDRPLTAKIALLERTLRAITARFDARTFRDRLPAA